MTSCVLAPDSSLIPAFESSFLVCAATSIFVSLDLLYAWVYGLAARKWSDVAVISKKGQLEALQCSGDDGRPLSGYECLFAPMPHVCTFNSVQVRAEGVHGTVTTQLIRKRGLCANPQSHEDGNNPGKALARKTSLPKLYAHCGPMHHGLTTVSSLVILLQIV